MWKLFSPARIQLPSGIHLGVSNTMKSRAVLSAEAPTFAGIAQGIRPAQLLRLFLVAGALQAALLNQHIGMKRCPGNQVRGVGADQAVSKT